MADAGSLNVMTDTAKIYNATTYSRNTELARKTGPVGQDGVLGTGAAIINKGARGILKQMNVGDVNSTADNLSKIIVAKTTGKGEGANLSA